jgi:hypothetical protein
MKSLLLLVACLAVGLGQPFYKSAIEGDWIGNVTIYNETCPTTIMIRGNGIWLQLSDCVSYSQVVVGRFWLDTDANGGMAFNYSVGFFPLLGVTQYGRYGLTHDGKLLLTLNQFHKPDNFSDGIFFVATRGYNISELEGFWTCNQLSTILSPESQICNMTLLIRGDSFLSMKHNCSQGKGAWAGRLDIVDGASTPGKAQYTFSYGNVPLNYKLNLIYQRNGAHLRVTSQATLDLGTYPANFSDGSRVYCYGYNQLNELEGAWSGFMTNTSCEFTIVYEGDGYWATSTNCPLPNDNNLLLARFIVDYQIGDDYFVTIHYTAGIDFVYRKGIYHLSDDDNHAVVWIRPDDNPNYPTSGMESYIMIIDKFQDRPPQSSSSSSSTGNYLPGAGTYARSSFSLLVALFFLVERLCIFA